MHLPRHTLSSQIVAPAFVSATFTPPSSYDSPSSSQASSSSSSSSSASSHTTTSFPAYAPLASTNQDVPRRSHLVACATRSGFLVAQTCPLRVVANKSFPPSQGGLAIAATIDDSSLLVLVGGGRVPRFSPNKVIIWDENAVVPSDDEIGIDPYEQREEEDLLSARGDDEGRSAAASTIFDAGSTFGGIQSRSSQEDQRDALEGLAERPTQQDEEVRQGSSGPFSDREASVANSLIGLAGMSSSGPIEVQQHSEADESGMAASNASISPSIMGSITATTEGLEDPFVEGTEEGIPRIMTPQREQQIYSLAESTSPTSSLRNVPKRSSQRDAQPRPAKAPVRGREVLELEFGEAVQSVLARSFDLPLSARGKETVQGAQGKKYFKMALLIVVLRTKAVVFELGEHIEMSPHKDSTDTEADRSAPWGILHRTTLDILDDGRGLVDLVGLPGRRSALLTLAGRQPGHLQLIILSLLGPKRTISTTTGESTRTSSGVQASSIIAAHSTALVSLTLSPCGSLLATASKKGTLVRVWSTTGTAVVAGKPRTTIKAILQMELRRGTEQAVILSMAFAPDRSILAAASDKGTIHFFNLSGERSASVGGAPPHSRTGSGSGDSLSSSPSSRPTRSGPISSPPPHSSGGTFGLPTSASKYLPSSLNTLASQIPASLLPSYLKSTWSTAQFRIKLGTFAAYNSEERATRRSSGRSSKSKMKAPSGADDEGATTASRRGTFVEDAPAGRAGASRSTEGAWATLKGRLEDIKRWEPALDERIFLSWVWVDDRDSNPSTQTERMDQQKKGAGAGGGGEYQLIAITTSGGWYRISLQDSTSTSISGEEQDTEDPVLSMYRASSSRRQKSGAHLDGGGTNKEKAHQQQLQQQSSRIASKADAAVDGGKRSGRTRATLEEYRTLAIVDDSWDSFGAGGGMGGR